MRQWWTVPRDARRLMSALMRTGRFDHRAEVRKLPAVAVRCGCGKVFETLYGSAEHGIVEATGGPGVEVAAGPGRPDHGGLLRREDVPGLLESMQRRRYRCTRRRCPGDYPVSWDRLDKEFRARVPGAIVLGRDI